MKKRFTDVAKWEKAWFRKLSPAQKCLWQYVVDRCDQAGVWEPDFELASFYIGSTVTEADFEAFGDRIVKFGEKYRIIGYIYFQNGKLSLHCKAHNPIFTLLQKYGFSPEYPDEVDEDEDDEPKAQKPKPAKKKADNSIIGDLPPLNKVIAVEAKTAPKRESATKEEVHAAIFDNEVYFEGISIIGKGKNMEEAFEECWLYHTSSKNPPKEVWEWKQKYLSWLTRKKEEPKQSHNGITGKNQQRVSNLIASFQERHGSDAEA